MKPAELGKTSVAQKHPFYSAAPEGVREGRFGRTFHFSTYEAHAHVCVGKLQDDMRHLLKHPKLPIPTSKKAHLL